MELDPEAIFGGIVFTFFLGLLLAGKLRLEREIHAKDEVIEIKDDTIKEQRKTIDTLTERDEVTHHLLKELRDLAMRNSIPGGGGAS